MIKIIDKVETGKTKKLLKECIDNEGIFVCRNPQSVPDKIVNYGFDRADLNKIISLSYSEFLYKEHAKGKPVYIDDVEKFLINVDRYIMGFSATNE